jgi:hypothetical protein
VEVQKKNSIGVMRWQTAQPPTRQPTWSLPIWVRLLTLFFFLRSASVSQPPKDSASTARDNILFLLAAGLLSWKLLSFFDCDDALTGVVGDGDNGGLPDDVCTYRQVPSHSHTLSAVGERWLAQWSR